MYKTIVILAVSFWIGVSSSYAQDENPAAEAKALELIEVMGGDKMFNDVLTAALTQAFELERRNLEGESLIAFDAYEALARKATSDLASEFSAEIAAIYVKHFSASEMDDLIQFYKSPTGVKLLQKLPELTADSMATGMQLGEKMVERISQIDATQDSD